METILLKNGTTEVTSLVKVVTLSLRELLNQKGAAALSGATQFYDIVSLCRDSNYQVFGSNLQLLKNLALVGEDGRVHESIKNIVLSSVEGEGLEMSLVNPVKA